MREILRMVLVLSVISAVSGFSLSWVRGLTEKPIQGNIYQNVLGPKIGELFPEHSNDPIGERQVLKLGAPGSEEALVFFPIRKEGELRAVAFEIKSKGYKGDIGILIGVDLAAEQLAGIRVTTHSETPGLGARSTEPEFYRQFDNLSLTQAVGLGSPIKALSGATITSRGVTEGVNRALGLAREHRDEIVAAFSGAQS